MEENKTQLDLEFKRYLQLIKPYLAQLMDHDVIELCNAWVKRLSNCKNHEKSLRNKHIFTLCYQLAKGYLDQPFLCFPPPELQPITHDFNSDESSSEKEEPAQNFQESKQNNVTDDKSKSGGDNEYISQNTEQMDRNLGSINYDEMRPKSPGHISMHNSRNTSFCCSCPSEPRDRSRSPDLNHQFRTNNLVKKLREIKTQNMMLQKELEALKAESIVHHNYECSEDTKIKVDTMTSCHGSDITVKSLKCQLQDVQESRKYLIQTVSKLQDNLDNFNDLKKNEIEEIISKHEVELINQRSAVKQECQEYYDKRIEGLKHSYEEMVKKIQEKSNEDIKEISAQKDEIIDEKNKLIENKDTEILCLRTQLEEQKSSLYLVLNKFIDKPFVNDDMSYDNMRIKSQQLEKRLNKTEKSKIKLTKFYEAKLAQIQREKHLLECSLQLQLVRQRAEVVSEMTNESQSELTSSLDKLESKYKDIVANVQAIALQRRLQDQAALNSIFKSAHNVKTSNESRSQFQSIGSANNQNQSFDSELSSLMRSTKVGSVVVGNKTYGENLPGFCLNGERMGKLFERVYLPQRDEAHK